jgi:hypothetical protein
LADLVLEALQERGLARASEDGVSIPMHPLVRATVLVLLAQILRETGRQRGLALQPVTDRQDVLDGLLSTWRLPQLPSAGRVIALDHGQVSLILASVPLDEVLEVELTCLNELDRARAFVDRREELADAADDLRRRARSYWRKPLAGFGLGLAGAAWSAHQGDLPGQPDPVGRGIAQPAGHA